MPQRSAVCRIERYFITLCPLMSKLHIWISLYSKVRIKSSTFYCCYHQYLSSQSTVHPILSNSLLLMYRNQIDRPMKDEIRKVFIKNYLLYYAVFPDRVETRRFLHRQSNQNKGIFQQYTTNPGYRRIRGFLYFPYDATESISSSTFLIAALRSCFFWRFWAFLYRFESFRGGAFFFGAG